MVVRVLVGKLMEIDATYETAARTLGASPFTAIRTISLPMLKSGIIASLILSFATSLSETGATLAVSKTFKTVSVLLVEWVKSPGMRVQTSVGTLMLMFFSIIFLVVFRYFYSRGGGSVA